MCKTINLWHKDWTYDRDGKNSKIIFYEYFWKINWLFKRWASIFMAFPSPQEICLVWSQYKFSIKHWLEKNWGYWIVFDWVFLGTKYYRRTDRRMTKLLHRFKLTYDINHINLSCEIHPQPPCASWSPQPQCLSWSPQLQPWLETLTVSYLPLSLPRPRIPPQTPVITMIRDPGTHLSSFELLFEVQLFSQPISLWGGLR